MSGQKMGKGGINGNGEQVKQKTEKEMEMEALQLIEALKDTSKLLLFQVNKVLKRQTGLSDSRACRGFSRSSFKSISTRTKIVTS